MVRLNAPNGGDRAPIFSERTVTEASQLDMLVPYVLPHLPHGSFPTGQSTTSLARWYVVTTVTL